MEDAASRLIPEKRRLPDERLTDDLNPEQADSPSHNSDDDCVIVNQTLRDPANPGEVNTKTNEVDDLQEMFYLPITYPALLSPKKLKNLNDILVNVAELLSRSPPSPENILVAGRTLTGLPPSPEPDDQPFSVRFSLEVDDDDDVEGGIEDGAPHSPTWDEVFEDESIRFDKKEMDLKSVDNAEERVSMDADCVSEDRVNVQMDESMDLFEDDEAFMQMTISDIPTPEDRITAEATINDEGIGKISKDCTEILNVVNKTPFSDTRLNIQTSHNSREDHYNKVSFLVKANPEPPDSSHDLFSVNFDLGYSLEDSEDEVEVASSPSPKKQAESVVSNSSTPRRSFAGLFKESQSSSQIKTDYWRSNTEELPSPVSLLGPRQMLLSRVAEPDSSKMNQKQAEGDSLQELIHLGESSPRPGLFIKQQFVFIRVYITSTPQ